MLCGKIWSLFDLNYFVSILDIPDLITSLVKEVHHGEKGNFSAMWKITLNIFVKKSINEIENLFYANFNIFICHISAVSAQRLSLITNQRSQISPQVTHH